jgi:hypothetical protein
MSTTSILSTDNHSEFSFKHILELDLCQYVRWRLESYSDWHVRSIVCEILCNNMLTFYSEGLLCISLTLNLLETKRFLNTI